MAYRRAQRLERAARASFLRVVSDHSRRLHTMQASLVPKHVARAEAVGEKTVIFRSAPVFFFGWVTQKHVSHHCPVLTSRYFRARSQDRGTGHTIKIMREKKTLCET